MGGDLNARVGTLGAYVEGEDRATKDIEVNREGKDWIELMDTYGLNLLNGNVNGDRNGNFTRMGYSHQEEAVLDYVAVSTEAWTKVESLTVGRDTHSDQFPLELSLRVVAVIEKCAPSWSQRDKLRFSEKMIRSPQGRSWSEIHDKLWQATIKRVVKRGVAKDKDWWNEKC